MCRLLGVVSSERTNFRVCMREAPRSLSLLSREHPHGWGVAVFDSDSGWTVEKRPVCANEDERFEEIASGSQGELLLAHIRKRTVGPMTPANTHPFRRGRWIFAHNGTIAELGYLRSRTSDARLAEIGGDTDSELFFAFLLTRLDEAGVADAPAGPGTDAALASAVVELDGREGFGASNFVFSDGYALYAHRAGRTLFLLERGPHASKTTPAWRDRRRAVLIASEQMTDEPWQPIDERTLLRVDRMPQPAWRVLG